MNESNPHPGQVATLMERILFEVKKVVVGQDHFLERVLVAILAQGHLLVEGVPGLAKTLTVKTLARTIRGSFKRIQFTPDLVPADLIGTRVYNQKSGDFSTALGPVFAHLLLADEINRAPAKVQSALLEVMQEYQVTIAGETHRVPEPFLVMATQNPIETEGTYPLPEAQVDRFMMKVLVGYPTEEEEFVIVERVTGAAADIAAVATTDELAQLQRECRRGYVDPALIQYAVRLVAATRTNPAALAEFTARYGGRGYTDLDALLADPDDAANWVGMIRDVFIIVLAMEGMLMGIALIVLILQLAALVNVLQNEIKPIVDNANETVTTVRVRAGKVSTTDGPFAETKEQLGGYLLIDVRDLNDAVRIASKFPAAQYGSIEVRPIKEGGCA